LATFSGENHSMTWEIFSISQLVNSSSLFPGVAQLVRSTFNVSHMPDDVQSLVMVVDGAVAGYCASRLIKVKYQGQMNYFDHLGLVCVAPGLQELGFGRCLVSAFLQRRNLSGSIGSILNCGEAVESFYEKLGFVRISDRASYMRESRLVVDEDPVLVFYYNGVGPKLKVEECIFLGTDL